MSDRNIADTAADEFAWRAFRYLHGELSAEEAEAFEEDLAVEQLAREALAEATRLTAALETAGDVGSTRDVGSTPHEFTASRPSITAPRTAETAGLVSLWRGSSWRGRLSQPRVLLGAGVGTAVAAGLAVVITLGLMGRFRPDQPDGPPPVDPVQAQAALAEAWLEMGGHEDWQNVVATPAIPGMEAVVEAAAHEMEASPVNDGQAAEDQDADSVPTVPSWLLAALDPQADGMPEDDQREIKQ